MDTKRTEPASTSTLTRALAVGVFACVGGAIAAQMAESAPFAVAAVIAAVVLAASAVVLEYRRAPHSFSVRTRPPLEAVPDEPTPARLSGDDERWLRIDSAYATQMMRMARIAYAVPFLLILLWAWLRQDIINPDLPAGTRAVGRLLEMMMAAIVLTCTIAISFMHRATSRMVRSRIGGDPSHLLYDPGTGKIERYEWPSVLTDKFNLLMGRRALSLLRSSGLRHVTIFPADELRALILPHLPVTSFVGRARLQWTALCRGNLSLWVTCAAVLVMAVLHLLKELHPEWFAPAREILLEWLRASIS